MSADSKTFEQMHIVVPFAMAGFVILFLAHQSIVLAVGAMLFVSFLAFMLRWPEVGTARGRVRALFQHQRPRNEGGKRGSANGRACRQESPGRNSPGRIVFTSHCATDFSPVHTQAEVDLRPWVCSDADFVCRVPGFVLFCFRRPYRQFNTFPATLLEGLALYFLITNVVRDIRDPETNYHGLYSSPAA